MKLKTLILPALLVSLLSAFPLQAEEKATVAFQVKVSDMSCAGCAFSITQELKKLENVSDVYVDAKTKTALVAVESDKAPGEKEILAAVKAAGYDPSDCKKLEVKFAEAKAALTGEKG